MVKIVIVEDQTVLREALMHLINSQEDMEVVGSTSDAAKALELCRNLQPDLVLMDVVTKNNSSGIRYTAEIRREFPQVKIVIITGLPEITFAEEAKKAGAHSYLYKNTEKEHLFYVIRSTMKGIGIYPGPDGFSHFAGKFTEREIAIIRFVCQGLERDEMAKRLEISESLVKHQITSILDKSGFDSISKFAIYAVGQGLIVPNL